MKQVKRLFADFAPKHYTLDLVPDRESMTFSGTVIISGDKTGRPSNRLTFHQKDLTISDVHVTRHERRGEQVMTVTRCNTHKTYDEVRIHTKEQLFPGHYTISLKFNGKITRPMNGMYPCFFTHRGKQKVLIATQFESHHAREVFPCIDEPEAKATFDLILTTPKGEVALSNMPIKRSVAVPGSSKSGFQKVSFQTTPHMSPYLLAFVYGEMGYKETKATNGTVVRAYATPDNVKFVDFALDTAVRSLNFYNDYFAIAYPLPKCDLIALPDFAAGAMENWGCITFREHAMLVDPRNTSLQTQQFVAMATCHELAHQWFGNLVTMRWWTDLWLNEGFASWVEMMAVDKLFPNWQIWTQFVVDEQQAALKLDALESTHAIEVPVNHPDEIRSIFDVISYSKGASALHMLHQYLGATDFRNGLRYYLKQHAYKNTDTIDLWSALEEVSHKHVRTFMQEWTSAKGFPIIRTTVNESGVTVTQQRFYANPLHHNKETEAAWPVPLLSNEKSLPHLLHDKKAHYQLKDYGAFKLNHTQSGYYRVIYNASHLERLAERIRRGKLAPVDRLGILADSFEAAKAGYVGTTDALTLLSSFQDEDNAAVWEIIASGLASVRSAMDDEDLREAMKPFLRDLVKKQLERLGWEKHSKESHFDQLLRPTILGMAALADEQQVVDTCVRLFAAMQSAEDLPKDIKGGVVAQQVRRGSEIDPDLRGVVYGTVARRGGKPEFDKLVDMYKATTSAEERVTLAAAITGFEQPILIKKALKMIKSDDVKLQDVLYWVAYSFMNRHARELTWEWIIKEWDWLYKNNNGDPSFHRFPIYAARSSSDLAFLKPYKQFFESVMNPAIERSVQQGIEIIEWQSAWKTRDLKLIKTFFGA